MLLAGLLSLLALPSAFAALSEHEQLSKLAASSPNGVIKLNETTYDLITGPKRTWSAAVHFTALDRRRRCNPCREFDPSWNAVSKAWSKVPAAERDGHFFATLDFDDSTTVFQKLGIASAPVIHVLPPTEGPRRPANGRTQASKYDFSNGFEPGPLAEQLSRHTPIPIPYKAPFDWTRWGSGIGLVLFFAITARFVAPVLQNKWMWAAVTIITTLTMTSGFMFTRIRGSPFTGQGGQWIAPGYSNQFGQETQVVAAIYGLLSIAFLMLTVVTPHQVSAQRQRAQVYLWTAVIFVVFSILISFFRVKNRGYPFKLLL